MLPGFNLEQFSHTAGPLAAVMVVAAIIFAESGLLVGFFLPGDSIIFTLGFLVQGMGKIGYGLNIHVIVFILFVAAALGDSVGYLTGNKIGPHIFKRPNSLLFRQENIKKAQDFYDEHGKGTIILARFVPIVRTFAPILAGVGKMNYRTFLAFNLIGAALWTGVVAYAGYFLGAWFTSIGIDIDTVLLPIVILIVLVSILPIIYKSLKTKEQRQAVCKMIKNQCQKITKHNK